ncbi:MAG TPA: OB-fold domain-containing protein [Acidimicrobiales bacterium]|nr:OB-fold domain-containing protein [Acidimicrobiales bacterium]
MSDAETTAWGAPWSAPFWEASREQRLVLQWCTSCNVVIHYPRPVCPTCMGDALEWRPAAGNGEVHSHTVVHKGRHPTLTAPYVVALVTLVEGARMMTNIVGCEPSEVKVGMAVRIRWEPQDDGRHLPLFEPTT